MNDPAQRSGARPLVCPFVALAEDRNRRADAPDQRNRCYAEPAPRQRDLAYQADYCYSPDFPTCSVFLAWAARNAAEPAYAGEAADQARLADLGASPSDGATGLATMSEDTLLPTPEGGLFGLPDERASGKAPGASDQVDWVSASAWAEAPWDEQAEAEAEELDAAGQASLDEADEFDDDVPIEEDLVGPKVPAALPMRRRRTRQRPIRSRGSGEWFYADPLDREPLVRRRYGITPPVLLGVLGLLVVALVVFLIPTLLSGGGEGQTAGAPTASPSSSDRPVVTRAPVVLATPQVSAEPSPEPAAQIRTYRVRSGDTLSLIAQKQKVSLKTLQCINGIKNPNLVQLDQRLKIPPLGYTCAPGWRRGATPTPESDEASPAAAEPSPGTEQR